MGGFFHIPHQGDTRTLAATLLLIRHAEHIDYDQRFSGRRPGVPLSERGRAQAAALGRRLAGRGLPRGECSPLDRTRETAEAIATACGLPAPTIAAPLIELDLGDWTGRAFGTFGDDPAWHAWNARRGTARIPGGETMGEAAARITGYLRRVAAASDGQVVAIVSHSDMIRAAVADVIGLPLDNLLRFTIDPASHSTVVMGDWGAKLEDLNVKGD